MKKFKIVGEIEAEDEEDARFKATIEGGNDILTFEEVKGRIEDFNDTLIDMKITKSEAMGVINFLIGYHELKSNDLDFSE
uniref:Uncharacterized protein n=1 Tax=viral metagenome TaxID=1070528 RepID=A0A6M3LUQ0_9ZZZZ